LRRNRRSVVFAWAFPVVGYLISPLVWGPSGPNLAPALLWLPVALMGSSVVRDGLVDQVPLARGDVFENLKGAVFVTDAWGRLIDANASARALALEVDGAEDIVGSLLDEACPRTARILSGRGEVDVDGMAEPRVLEVESKPIVDRRGALVGRSVIARNVTEAVLQRRELERIRDILAHEVAASEELRVELGDQVIHDSATGLYNRRFLTDSLPAVVESCVADGSPLSIVVVDIDDFKSVNDSWGHVVGDRVIEAVAKVLKDSAPSGLVVRYGGDEYLALLPGVSAPDALAMAESMRVRCSELEADTRDGPIQVTVSAGVATLVGDEIDAGELLEVADLALYRAKESGRNRTWSQADGAV
jgi:diguanylate cyclase (GGDEF)-like protein